MRYTKLHSLSLSLTMMLPLVSACDQYEFDNSYFGGDSKQEESTTEDEEKSSGSEPNTPLNLPSVQSVSVDAASHFESTIDTLAEPQLQANGDIHTHLTAQQFPGLFRHFDAVLLSSVKVIITTNLPMPQASNFGVNPSLLQKIGLDFEAIHEDTMAITYDRTIYIKPQFFATQHENVLFHEMIHVLQYKDLGRETFALWYSYFHLKHGDHNPLEEMAYKLDESFVKGDVPAQLDEHVHTELDAIKPKNL